MRTRQHRTGRVGGMVLAAAAMAAAGCGGDPPALEPPAASTAAVEEITDSVRGALEGMGEAMRVNRSFGEIVGGGVRLLPGLVPPHLLRRLAKLKSPELDARAIAGVDGKLQAFHRTLSERVLVPENLESQSDTEMVYRLRPEATCRALDGDTLDERCVRLLSSAVEVRVVVSTVGLPLRLRVTAGDITVQPILASASPTSIFFRFFLAELKQVSALASSALGEPDPLPAEMSGVVDFRFTRTGAEGIDVSVALQTSTTINDPDRGVHLTIGESLPLVTFIATKPFTETSFAIRPGGIQLRTPWQPADGPADGELEVNIAAFTAQGSYRESARSARPNLDPVDAPSFVAVRGQRIWEQRLGPGPEVGLLTSFIIAPTADGRPSLTVRPDLDVTTIWKLGAIAAELSEPPPSYLLDETYRLEVMGRPFTENGALFEALTTDADSGVRLVRGSVSLSSSAAAGPLTATEGQCLVPRQPTGGDHPVLGAFEVATCP